jgi:transposase
MEHYAGIDVSLECSSVCIVDMNGKIIREGKAASEPDALIGRLRSLGYELRRIGLEAGPLSQWLFARCGKRGWRSNCWRHGTRGRRSRPCA